MNNDLIVTLGIIANLCQLESYAILKDDVANNFLVEKLNIMMINQKRIIEQNNKIIELLERGENNV